MKAVVNALINIGLVDFIMRLQRVFIGGPAFINAAIESGIMQQQRRFNFIDLIQRRLAAVKRHRAGQLRDRHRRRVADAAAVAEPGDTDLPRRLRMLRHKRDRRKEIIHQLHGIDFLL